ncbi:MAG: 3-dehydroquinate synthase [Proteobacteria bacterium]|nr:3-dehydroquinate synthase [Pseudomonadota bacterium]MCH8175458.1 3-dehydroquinate synthase [Pseudomonadota bacterium]
MQTVVVNLGDRTYPIHIGSQLITSAELVAPYLARSRVVIVSNDVVAPLYLEQAKSAFTAAQSAGSGESSCKAIVLPDGEAHKNLAAVAHIYDELLAGKYDRNTVLVALGGGVVGDITGFAAATYLRGIQFIQMPTTLLAQVDSAVGGKTGVNHPLGKNMIGAFYQPKCVIVDTDVLTTLPVREVRAGLAEVLKYGLISKPEFFHWLAENCEKLLQLDPACLTQAIKTCCEAKADVVAADEKESGVRALLNLGHTFGHAIETATGYGTWLHGETVAMGMVMAADLSMRLGWIEQQTAQQVRTVLEINFGLPVVPPGDISTQQYLELMASDKKAELGKLRFVLLKAIGQAVIEADIDSECLQATLKAGNRLCR